MSISRLTESHWVEVLDKPIYTSQEQAEHTDESIWLVQCVATAKIDLTSDSFLFAQFYASMQECYFWAPPTTSSVWFIFAPDLIRVESREDKLIW